MFYRKIKVDKHLNSRGSTILTVAIIFVVAVILIGFIYANIDDSVESYSFDGNAEFYDVNDENQYDYTHTEYHYDNETDELSSEVTSPVTDSKKKASDFSGKDAGFKITMLDVGQGLSLLVEADGRYMLYDGGPSEKSSYVVSYLKKHGISHLSYMVVSHYDADHISGLIGVLNTASVEKAVTPDYKLDTKTYLSFRSKLASNGAKEIHPSAGDTFSLGKADITVLSADYNCEEENSRSIAVRVTYGTFSCIVTGDAEEDEEKNIVHSGYDISSDLYVVGHHGSSSSTSQDFLEKVNPSYAFISVGSDNSYGHPTKQTLLRLSNNSTGVFRTDVQGEVTCYSDGEKYWFSTEPTSNLNPGTNNDNTHTIERNIVRNYENSTEKGSGYSWVLNTNTKRIHYPYCDSVTQMDPRNRSYSDESVSQLEAKDTFRVTTADRMTDAACK